MPPHCWFSPCCFRERGPDALADPNCALQVGGWPGRPARCLSGWEAGEAPALAWHPVLPERAAPCRPANTPSIRVLQVPGRYLHINAEDLRLGEVPEVLADYAVLYASHASLAEGGGSGGGGNGGGPA